MKTFRRWETSLQWHVSRSYRRMGIAQKLMRQVQLQDDRSLSFGTMHIECSRDELCSLSLVSRRIGLQVTILRVFER